MVGMGGMRGGGGGGGGGGMFSSPVAVLTRVGPFVLALVALLMYSSSRAELASLSATLSARVAEVEGTLRGAHADLRLERDRGKRDLAEVRRKDAAELAAELAQR